MVISRQLCLTVGLGPTRQEGATDHQYHSAHCRSVDVVALNHDSQTERHHGDQVGDERGSSGADPADQGALIEDVMGCS